MEFIDQELVQSSLSLKLKKRARLELLCLSAMVIVLTLTGIVLDFELLGNIATFTLAHEDWELDEIFMFILWSGMAGCIYAIRRMQDIWHLNQEIASLAFIDPVTHLPNRILALERLSQILARAERMQSQVAVMFLDFDNFKFINDTYGHIEGDNLIRVVGQRLRTILRKGDTVGRLGGDEFVLVVEYLDEQELLKAINRIQTLQTEAIKLDSHELNIAFSVGIAVYPKDGNNPSELLKASDIAMYKAKQAGKGQLQFYTQSMGEKLMERYELEAGLKTACHNQELFLEYQPQLCTESQRITGYEALVRWRRNGITIPPLSFIQVAEETGLIQSIGDWIFTQALEEAKTFVEEGQILAINVSPCQFSQPGFVNNILKRLTQSDFPPDMLELEITESALVQDESQAMARLMELRKLGVQVAIDDFGTGYSSLGRLRYLAVTRIKIDRLFINTLCESDIDQNMVKAMIALADNLGMDVIAEGVETAEQSDLLRTLGCNLIQGYFFSRPVPAAKLNALKTRYYTDVSVTKSAARS
ncbi:putative bifunctional diguanylate cyclase/phosphodiesterase [Bowmanella denitrificans]|uniref:putative bifunctional diguanylate cyclase/phosphodiesterase n=1 Tax=Bowmanella denitrificans TaxID=366582 RepID=UPI000C9CF861|nr:EAL domain-containing protein [Bowmanella denitrificans]